MLHQVDGLYVCVKDIVFVLIFLLFDIEYIFFTTLCSVKYNL